MTSWASSNTLNPSNVASTRRGGTPSSLALSSTPSTSSTAGTGVIGASSGTSGSTARATISLEEWERKAPLSELQIRTVAKVMKATEKVPLPLKFAEEPDLPGTPIPSAVSQRLANKLLAPSRPGTPANATSTPGTPRTAGPTHALHPSHPVQTPQQFYDWFALIDRSVAHSQEAHYRAHLSSLSTHLETCDLLLSSIASIEEEVGSMLEGWRSVEEGGNTLKGACERLLEERDTLVGMVDEIGGTLEYFQELEHATRMLNHPGESLIFQADFLYMVERVDVCIDFLRGHRHYREAEVYLLRFQQCMTRAMTLIKMNFVGSLRALSAEISKRISDKEVSMTAQHHLLYTRFLSVASRVSPLLSELERRAAAYPDELGALLGECRSAYFATRRALLVPRIMEEIRGLDPGRSELVELTRAGCSYLKQLCTDEFYLYREFFSTAEDQLYQYLETLCDLLYDDLRPRILHEPRLTVLCEVCTVLQALMVLDASGPGSESAASSSTPSEADDSDEGDSEEEDEAPADSKSKPTRARRSSRSSSSSELTIGMEAGHERKRDAVGKRLHTGHLLKMVLQDAQTRLFFKAQSVIQSEIRHYVPRPEDLAWPDILVAANKPLADYALQEKAPPSTFLSQSLSDATKNPALQRQETWYPTLRKMVWVLAQLHDFIKPAIFEDIAQEAVGVCRASIVTAGEAIRVAKDAAAAAPGQPGKDQPALAQQRRTTGALDGALFTVRHLLILKEILASLEADLKERSDEDGIGSGGGRTTSIGGSSNATGGGLLSPRGPSTGRAVEFGSLGVTVGSSVSGGVAETLTNMLTKTTSYLPEGLFASLGVTRGAESDLRGVKLEIDASLRKACEDVIAACSAPICHPLESWGARLNPSTNPSGGSGPAGAPQTALATSLITTSTAITPQIIQELATSAPKTHLLFLEAIQRDLRSAVARVRLYLEEERTARVLLEHVVERVSAVYDRFGEGLGRVGLVYKGTGEGGVDLMVPAKLREMLREVCRDEGQGSA
ncbi:unnamed protein product [Cyclocybe aegerita]|uniref:Conserved oligomeric Golgi complex subunit 3 n=1 Tax=Cyclocybe aegerita TaxID=1973307 RepID=A0A8S0WWX4_CYCAE|nr:unnamed protein product [Cyclocybe aegerita]